MTTIGACIRYGLLAVVVVAPIPFGSVQPGAVLGIELAALGLFVASYFSRRSSPQAPDRLVVGAAVGVVAIITIGLVQLLPLPGIGARQPAATREALAMLVPETAGAMGGITLDPLATIDALLRFMAYMMLGVAAYLSFSSVKRFYTVLWTVVTVAACQALYGTYELLSGRQQILSYVKRFHLDSASGTFINRNHFAALLAIALPLAISLVLQRLARMDHAGSFRQRVVRLAEGPGPIVLLGVAASGAIVLGVVLSDSRSGLVAVFGATIASGLLARRRFDIAVVSGLALCVAVPLFFSAREAPGSRFVTEIQEVASLGGRLDVWRETVRMAIDFAPLGSGLGTFETAFVPYRGPWTRAHWDHAHNDWLQSAAEGGVVVLLAVALLLFCAVVSLWRSRDLAMRGAAVSLVTAAVLAAVDFPTRIPAIAAILAIMTGAGFGASSLAVSSRAAGNGHPSNQSRRG